MFLALVAVAAVLAIYFLTRIGELFELSIRDGRVLVVRGRVPPSFLNDVRDVLTSPLGPKRVIRRASIVAVKTERGGQLQFSGDLDEASCQRLRNTFSLYTTARLIQAPAIAKPTLGQLLGVASIAWLFDGIFRRD